MILRWLKSNTKASKYMQRHRCSLHWVENTCDGVQGNCSAMFTCTEFKMEIRRAVFHPSQTNFLYKRTSWRAFRLWNTVI
jgi:hypothetical protein